MKNDFANKTGSMRSDSGGPLPLGVQQVDGGINFAIFSRHATRVWLELFSDLNDKKPWAVFELDPENHRTGDIWHIRVFGIEAANSYAFRVDGPYRPDEGHRFNLNKLLLDPYATALVGTDRWDFGKARGFQLNSPLKDLSFSTEDNSESSAKCLLHFNRFSWQEDQPPKQGWSETIIYETHVRGLTIHPSSLVRHPGTFLGIAEKIPYFKELGITALELMPIQEFNENGLERKNPLTGEPLRNYWGYNTISFFAPKEKYSTRCKPGCQIHEFKTMVRELHRAGIEVILDIVLNHTAEEDELGPTINFRGLDNRIYYILDAERRFYKNFSGCGNTLNCNHPVVQEYILDCLHYWVAEMHIDGFRFDLASVLGRGENGELLSNPPLLEAIAEDPVLRDTKLIAEAWDAAGAYQVGSFGGKRWSEWNAQFRDDVRRFWRGDPGMIGAFASRICGSADIYETAGKKPSNSINFITCHDGFTLNDLVTYKQKHNEGNGEANRDGPLVNYSENYGIEGETENPEIEHVRKKQIKNMLTTLFISRGVPMLLGGDEFRRTQKGNNNAYCQDNELSWYDWNLVQKNQDIVRFTKQIIAFRKRHEVLRSEKFYNESDIHWFGPSGDHPSWHGPEKAFGCLIHPRQGGRSDRQNTLCLLFNAEVTEILFQLPPPPKGALWYLAADTSRPSPEDINGEGTERPLENSARIRLEDRSTIILISK